jgi:ornithine carbamoyltransferase
MSRYVDGIMLRTFSHETLLDLARFASMPVINGLSDLLHPCQIMADVMTIQENFGADLQGRKVAWVGDGNNMANSWLNAAYRFGFELRLACPEGTILTRDSGARPWCHQHPADGRSEGSSRRSGCREYGRLDVHGAGGRSGRAGSKAFAGYHVDSALMARAAGHAIFLHCLPAHRGEEVAAEVIEGSQSRVFDEAENRLHAQKALMVRLMGSTNS